jgi:hypothetical protein
MKTISTQFMQRLISGIEAFCIGAMLLPWLPAAIGAENSSCFQLGKGYYEQGSFLAAIETLKGCRAECGEHGQVADSCLYYLGKSFAKAVGEYTKIFDSFGNKKSVDIQHMIGDELYGALRKQSIERNHNQGSADEDLNKHPEQIDFGIKHLYAEKMFLEKYGKFGRYKKFDFVWYGPIYTKDEYVELLAKYPNSVWARDVFLHLANIRVDGGDLDRKHPTLNFDLLDYEGFGSFAGLATATLNLYKKYGVKSGLSAALIRLNLLYPKAGEVEIAEDLDQAITAYQGITEALPDDENGKAAIQILRELQAKRAQFKTHVQ